MRKVMWDNFKSHSKSLPRNKGEIYYTSFVLAKKREWGYCTSIHAFVGALIFQHTEVKPEENLSSRDMKQISDKGKDCIIG